MAFWPNRGRHGLTQHASGTGVIAMSTKSLSGVPAETARMVGKGCDLPRFGQKSGAFFKHCAKIGSEAGTESSKTEPVSSKLEPVSAETGKTGLFDAKSHST